MGDPLDTISALGKEMGLTRNDLRAWIESQQQESERRLAAESDRKKEEHSNLAKIQESKIQEEEKRAEALKLELQCLQLKKDLADASPSNENQNQQNLRNKSTCLKIQQNIAEYHKIFK